MLVLHYTKCKPLLVLSRVKKYDLITIKIRIIQLLRNTRKTTFLLLQKKKKNTTFYSSFLKPVCMITLLMLNIIKSCDFHLSLYYSLTTTVMTKRSETETVMKLLLGLFLGFWPWLWNWWQRLFQTTILQKNFPFYRPDLVLNMIAFYLLLLCCVVLFSWVIILPLLTLKKMHISPNSLTTIRETTFTKNDVIYDDFLKNNFGSHCIFSCFIALCLFDWSSLFSYHILTLTLKSYRTPSAFRGGKTFMSKCMFVKPIRKGNIFDDTTTIIATLQLSIITYLSYF